MSTNRNSRRTRTALMAGAALSVLATVATPMIEAAQADTGTAAATTQATADQPKSMLTADGSFSEVIKMARPAVVTITTERQLDDQNAAMGGGMGQIPQGTPFDEFFQRFFGQGMPGQGMPGQGGPNQAMPGQPPQMAPGQPPVARALGSGFIVDKGGLIVTNNHVIDGATKIQVVLDDGTELDAKLVGRDPKTDLAVLKVDAKQDLPTVKWGDSSQIEAGDRVIAIGNPFGVGTTVTSGIVSARGRDLHNGPYDDFLQVDAALNHGNSGGPLIDAYGQVIGVSDAIYSPNDGNVGLGFAIPSDMAKNIVAELTSKGSVERGYLGVKIQPVTRDIADALGLKKAKGAMVVEVEPGTPAEKAGLLPGDIVQTVNGTPVADSRELSRAIADLDPGATPDLGVWRGGEEVDLNVTLASLPDSIGSDQSSEMPQQAEPQQGTDLPELGLSVSELTPPMRAQFGLGEDTQGVVVSGLDKSFSADVDIRPGDVILSVNSHAVESVADVKQNVQQALNDDRPSVLMMVERAGNKMFIAVPVGHA